MAVIPIPQHILQNGVLETSDILNLYYLLTNALANDIAIDGGITASSLITANGGLTVPSGQTATVAGTMDVTGAMTLSGALNANGGLTVPSGQTATVAGSLSVTGSETVASSSIGTLSVTGSATVPAATASANPVQLGQILNNVAPPSIGSNSLGGTALSIGPTGSFTAPSTGNLLVTVFASSSGNEPITASGTASLAGLTNIGDSGVNSYTQRILYYLLPMNYGNATTLSASMSVTTAANLSLMVTSVFQPNP